MDRRNRAPYAHRRIASAAQAAVIEIERLELRRLMAADFRTIDGTGNNPLNPLWGSAGVALLRTVAAEYADGVSDPAGEDRPSAREISNELVAQTTEERIEDDRFMSAMMYAFGQFIDHDIDLTPNADPAESFNIIVPSDADDPFSTAAGGPGIIPLKRSAFDEDTGTDDPREQVNVITAYLDGSMIYGSDEITARKLRTLRGGRLKTSPGPDGRIGTADDLLPFNSAAYFPDGVLSMDNNGPTPDDELFAAGDVRANENAELTSLHTLFVREHNRLAAQIRRANPGLSDEAIYQQARARVGAELQAITYNQWLPTLLGRNAIDRYDGYDPTVNAGIANEFSTAVFRVGHTMLGEDVEFLDNDGEEVAEEIELNESFFNPSILSETGVGPILKYLASDPSSRVDNSIVDAVRNFLFGPPGAGGFDLASLNIQRGRDHGLADYNATREAYGLEPVDDFDDISSDPAVAGALEELYGSVDDIDLWVGALAEDHARGASVGPLVSTVIADQFERLRDGDRYWYEAAFSGTALSRLRGSTLADVIGRNTEIDNLQDNVFVFNATVTGSLYWDDDRDERRDRGERGLSGWTVELVDAEGLVVAATASDSSGRYRFAGLELGEYAIRVTDPTGWSQTTDDADAIAVTRGGTFTADTVGYDATRTGSRR